MFTSKGYRALKEEKVHLVLSVCKDLAETSRHPSERDLEGCGSVPQAKMEWLRFGTEETAGLC